MELGFEITQEQRTRNLPRLIEANYLLHLNATELQTLVTAELADNPALEMAEDEICHSCGAPLENGSCSNCIRVEDLPTPSLADDAGDWSEVVLKSDSNGDDFDPMTAISGALDQREELETDLRAILPPGNERLALVLVESLDERGFLSMSTEELASLCDVDIPTIELAIAMLQEIAPPGVGARDLRESLLLQIQFLREHDIDVPCGVEALVSNHLGDLAAHRYHQLSRALDIDTEAIAAAHEFIRDQLSPQPWSQQRAATSTAVSDIAYVRPDVVIGINDDNEISIKVSGGVDRSLRLNGLYQELASSLRGASTTPLESDDDRSHVRDAVTRARQFMGKLQQRRETLERISLCTVTMQEAFVRQGVRELRTLTRADVANELGIHESTVSRAIAGKYVMLPNSKVVPLSTFFSASLSTKDAIREIIEREAANGNALADREIVQRLLEQGYRVARRTVAKYRSELGILPSTLRA
jgi:RNA polymerase sigma-54 factor